MHISAVELCFFFSFSFSFFQLKQTPAVTINRAETENVNLEDAGPHLLLLMTI